MFYRQTGRSVAAVAVSIVCLLATAAPMASGADLDYDLTNGHFYTQTNGAAIGAQASGYSITDGEGIPFWTSYQRFGGVDSLGYPITRRFVWDGMVCQATQRGILQWHLESGEVRLANTMDHLTKIGQDDQLANNRHVPKPAIVPWLGESFDQIAKWRIELLSASPAIGRYFESVNDPLPRFGLPMSPVSDVGPARAVRFQRAVLYEWKTDQPWAKAGTVSMANIGEFMKEIGALPAEALSPEPPPPARERQVATRGGSRTEFRLSGVATWYGAYFQGRPMANGRPFDMWNPGTAASNSHPLGTRLKVTRVVTGKSIFVVVTDRGGFRPPIMVDLSYAAFSQLAHPDEGVIRVIVDLAD